MLQDILNYSVNIRITVPMVVLAGALAMFFVLNRRITGVALGVAGLAMVGVINF